MGEQEMGGGALGERTLLADVKAEVNAGSVLPGKLRPPRLRDMLVRPRLMPQAYPESGPRLINICAGPGYGKTTLMAQIAKNFNGRSVWYQIDAQDRDPAVFLRHLIAGINHSLGKSEPRILSRFGNAANMVRDDENIIMALIDELSEHPADSLLLCFDDLHLFSQKDRVPHLIDILAQNLPDNAGMVIASRETPKISLGRLRSQGLLSDLRERDLEFSFDELSDLMRTWDIEATEKTLHRVHESTEGWAAGLVLMENHLRSSDKIPDLFSDRQIQQNVYEYLAEEVLQALPEDMQDFLKRVSLVDPIEPAICSAALGIEGAGRMLAQAERSNLFTSCLDDVDSYRFHPLFRDFLLTHFRREQGEEVQKLRISFAWAYKRAGKKRAAIHQFLESDCHNEAVELIEEIGEEMLQSGEYLTLKKWMAGIDKTQMTPALEVYKSMILLTEGKAQKALRLLFKAQINISVEDVELYCCSKIITAECLAQSGKFHEGVEVLSPMLDMSLPAKIQADVLFVLGACYWNVFDDKGVRDCLNKAKKLSEDEADIEEINKLNFLNIMQDLRQGDFPKACNLLKTLVIYDGLNARQSELIQNNLASSLMMMAKYEKAETVIADCLQNMKEQQSRIKLSDILDTHGCLLIAQEEWERGRLTLEEALESLSETEYNLRGDSSASILCHLGTLHRRKNDIEEAKRFHRESISIAQKYNKYYEIAMGLTNLAADLLRASGSFEEAKNHLIKACEIATQYNMRYILTQVDFNNAWLAHLRGDEKTKVEEIVTSFQRAKQFQHNHFMIQEGKISLPLFTTALENDIETDYVCWLLEKIGPESLSAIEPVLGHEDSSVRAKIAASLGNIGTTNAITLLRRMRYDPDEHVAEIVRNSLRILRKDMNSPLELLTPREAEVLKWLSDGLSNCQIAAKLFISDRTVKTHVAKIFRKLGFTNRIDAAIYFKQFNEDTPPAH